MENFKFKSELLNEYFREVTGKTEYTVDDLNALPADKRFFDMNIIGNELNQEDLDILTSLNNATFNGINFANLIFRNAKMKTVEFVNCNLEEVSFENNGIEEISISGSRLKNNSIEQFSGINGIKSFSLSCKKIPNRDKILSEYPNFRELPQEEKIRILTSAPENMINPEIDLAGISNFGELTNIFLKNIQLNDGAIDEITGMDSLESLYLNSCGISDVKPFANCSRLKSLNLFGNNISRDSITDLSKLVETGVNVGFGNTDAQRFLSEQQIEIEDKEIEKKVKSIFGVSRLDLYEMFNTKRENTSVNAEVFEVLVKTGLIKNMASLELDLKSFESIDFEKLLEERDRLGSIKIESFRGLTHEKLDELEVVNWKVEGDTWNKLNPYTTEDMHQILQALDKIKSDIPTNANNLEKFLTVYNNVAMGSYDTTGLLGAENMARTRGLKGILVDRKAVCYGFALGLEKCLDYSTDIEVLSVSGYVFGDPGKGHAWNQVNIDGVWYNADPTWDRRMIQAGMSTGDYGILPECLKSDEEFYVTHTAHDEQILEVCARSYDSHVIQETLKRMHTIELEKSTVDISTEENESLSRSSNRGITVDSYRKIAEANPIDSRTTSDIRQIINNSIDIPQRDREEISGDEL